MNKRIVLIHLTLLIALLGAACSTAPKTATTEPTGAVLEQATAAGGQQSSPTDTAQPAASGGGQAPAAADTQPAGQAQTTGAAPAASSNTLAQVKQRGKLVCGVHGQFQGFGFLDSNGQWSGFDVDICRAIAAAIFNDPNAIEFRGLSAQARFTALQSGEVDVLSRNSTWTLTRDAQLGLTWGPVVFYDGQAIMVKNSLTSDPTAGLKALEGANVCVQSGTTTELNLADQMRAAGVNYTPVVFEDQNAAFQAYDEGRCDAITSDRSQLATQGQAVLKNFSENTILDVVMSKEPLAPATRQGDEAWSDIVHWVIYGLIQAEELGITSQNVDTFKDSQDPVIRRLLGTEGELGSLLGLTNDFAYRAIKQVGNYGEIYERNLNQYNLSRGLNDLWTNGGLMYALPYR